MVAAPAPPGLQLGRQREIAPADDLPDLGEARTVRDFGNALSVSDNEGAVPARLRIAAENLPEAVVKGCFVPSMVGDRQSFIVDPLERGCDSEAARRQEAALVGISALIENCRHPCQDMLVGQ